MNSSHWVILAMFMGSLAGSDFFARASVVKNPVDLTPTALRASGATYGSNVVASGDSNQQEQREANDSEESNTNSDSYYHETSAYHHRSSRESVRASRSSAITLRESQELASAANHSVDLNGKPVMVQQEQRVDPEPSLHSGWSLAIIAMLVVAGAIYTIRRRNSVQ